MLPSKAVKQNIKELIERALECQTFNDNGLAEELELVPSDLGVVVVKLRPRTGWSRYFTIRITENLT